MGYSYKIDDKDLEVLLIEYDIYPKFLIRYTSDKNEYYCDFEVYVVESWDNDNTPLDIELYLHGTIKWDGCSHIYFGNTIGNTNGYIHICGNNSWKIHTIMMETLYKTVSSKIENFDESELW